MLPTHLVNFTSKLHRIWDEMEENLQSRKVLCECASAAFIPRQLSAEKIIDR